MTKDDPLRRLSDLIQNPPANPSAKADGSAAAEDAADASAEGNSQPGEEPLGSAGWDTWEHEVTAAIRDLLSAGETVSIANLADREDLVSGRLERCLQQALSFECDEPLNTPAPQTARLNLEATTDHSDPLPDTPPSPPQTLGRYRVDATLGSGGFGVVYKAWDDQLQRTVAIKVARRLVRPSKGTDAQLAEARFLAKLDHAGIVPVYDVGQTEDGAIYVVSKYVEGSDLASSQRQKRLGYREAARIVAQVAEALDYAHQQGVVHRDIKPGNILLTSDGEPIVVDFGLAIQESEFGQGSTFVGTPAYMSPEQARREGHRVDGRSDIYSLGAVLYQLLTGSRPFNASSIPALLELIRSVEVRPPRQVDRNVPRELERICLRALSKRVGDRYNTARDMAEELADWAEGSTSVEASAVSTPPSAATSTTAGSGASRSAELAIIPRGLRAFESSDADFFLRLLPGPADRDGLPESVRFWKTRIEELDVESTFRVGVLLGPSGSGKSSLIRAGVIPHLSKEVITIWVDTRSQDVERRLLKRLKKRVPSLEGARSLHEAMVAIRRNRGIPAGSKLVLVLDQFEQWLNHHRTDEGADLVDALRQCDGVRLQALLLIRDDFTLDAAQFMDQIEEPLSQTRNFATVDLFGKEHARKVLTAFGLAYGALSDPAPREQQRFLDAAVDGMADAGRIIPIQLALFADMVKDKPWTMATLSEYGGMQGIGVAFLDEKLVGAGAHPFLRSQSELTRQLLRLLLPDEIEVIRGRAKTRSELIQHFSRIARPDSLDRVLGLLDSELRLITPSGGDPGISAESASSSREPAFQLTHDYLVPTIRRWLTASERETRAGRERLRLSELSESWNARPHRRRLPSLWEWASIRWFTRSREWTSPQRLMMRAADRHLGLRAGWLTAVLFLAALLGYLGYANLQAQLLRNRLLDAVTSEAEPIIEEMRPQWARVGPLMEAEWARMASASASSPKTERWYRRRLHTALALADDHPDFLGSLLPEFPRLPPDDLRVVGRFYRGLDPKLRGPLWETLADPQTRGRQRLTAASLLAACNSEDPRWAEFAGRIADDLCELRAVQLADWVDHFHAVRDALIPELMGKLVVHPAPPTAYVNAVEALSVYAREEPEKLAEALGRADPQRIETLLAPLRDLGPEGAAALRREFDRLTRKHVEPAPASVASLVEQFGGASAASGGCLLRIPLPQLEDVGGILRKASFHPTTLRIYSAQQRRFASVAFASGGQAFDWKTELNADQIREFSGRHRESSPPLQLADFHTPLISKADSTYAALWVESDQQPLVFLEEPYAAHQTRLDELEDYRLSRFMFDTARGEIRCSSIWTPNPGAARNDSFTHTTIGGMHGDRNPGYLQTDLRVARLAPSEPLVSEMMLTIAKYARSESPSLQAIVVACLLGQGRHEEGKRLAQSLAEQAPKSARYQALFAEASARAGDADGLRASLEKYQELGGSDATLELLLTRQAALNGEREAADAQRAALEARLPSEDSSANEWVAAARANLVVSRMTGVAPQEAQAIRNRAAQQLVQAVDRKLRRFERVLEDEEFRSLYGEPAFQQLLRREGMDRRYYEAWGTSLVETTKVLAELGEDAHQREAKELFREGYQLAAANPLFDTENDRVVVATLWRRPVRLDDGFRERRLALLAIALAQAGETEYLLDVMRDGYGRMVRSFAIEFVHPAKLPSRVLCEAFRTNVSPSMRRAILLALGEFPPSELSDGDREYFAGRLRTLVANAADAGLRSAAKWCGTQWKIKLPSSVANASKVARGDQDWYVNAVGQTMIVCQAGEVLMGSPHYEAGRDEEQLNWIRIDRRFAIGDTETTVGQFKRFLADRRAKAAYPDGRFYFTKSYAPSNDHPQVSIRWYDAARFCQWLSEVEGLPEEEWCYPGIWDADPKQWRMPPDYLTRTGYRLPTEAEWEFACRAGSLAARSYGGPDELLASYAWHGANANDRPHPVAHLKPNDWGLFDTLGNVAEWCQERFQQYELPYNNYARSDDPRRDLDIPAVRYRVIRGADSKSRPRDLRSANRYRALPGGNAVNYGFRVVRTLPNQ